MKTKIKWIVETGIFLALLVVLQAVTKPFGPLVTGSAVNFILIATTLLVGMSSGLTIAVISPFLALLIGIVPLPIYIVPVVAIGNAVIVLVYGFVLGKFIKTKQPLVKSIITWAVAIVAGAGLKFVALYAGVNWIVVPLMTAVKGGVVKAPAAIFSASQMITAAIGGILAVLIVPIVKQAISKKA